jgi:two-component system NtrC family sensor kinase
MPEHAASLLVVDSDPDFRALLVAEACARGYRVREVMSAAAAAEVVATDSFDAVLVDLSPGAESAFDLLARIRNTAADAEVIVMSDRTSMAATIQWFDPDAFAFVRKTDLAQLFAAVSRALERHRITAQNRRLVWELRTINDIASGIARSLELSDVLTGALQGLVRAMNADGGAIRLRDEFSDAFLVRAAVGPPPLGVVLSDEWPGDSRPSDQVIATRAAVIVDDFAEPAPQAKQPLLPLRSAISVPLLAGAELLGTLSLGSTRPRHFEVADQHLLATIAGQIVVAIRNAQLHQSILRAKQEWEQTFDAISDPIAVFNNRGELLRGNRALADRLSMPVTSMRRLSCREVGFCGGAGECTDCAIRGALAQHEWRGEVTLPDGQIFSVTAFPVGLPSAGPSVVQVAKNVTEEIRSARRLQQMSDELAATNSRLIAAMSQLKSTQAQLLQAEKLSAIGQLVAGVAHELNNPLTSVIGYAQLLEEELGEDVAARAPDEVARDLRRIAEESERAARIVRNLLAFARRQGAERAPHDIADVCERVLALRGYEFRLNGIALERRFPASLPKVLADGGQLQQVLLNLILNAEHAMRGERERRLVIAARHDVEAGAVELSVTDSGHGIDPANLSRVFDPFFTTREVGQGTGLGLSICYGIVRDHGGHIGVESRRGCGTTFRILLPALLDDARVHGQVLVAHPEQGDREFLVAALKGWGYQSVGAATLAEALEGYAGPELQLAIVDGAMLARNPEAWQRRTVPGRRPPLVVISAQPEEEGRQTSGRTEAVVVVAPIQLAALRTAIRASVKECV